MALFLVAGLVFSHGLGHAPPLRVCTAHSLGVPAALAASAGMPGATNAAGAAAKVGAAEHARPADRAAHAHASADVPRVAVTAVFAEFGQPAPPPPPGPEDTCLSLAVLLAIVVIGLAARCGLAVGRRPRRSAWIPAPPPLPAPCARSLSRLQVLRL